MEIDGLKTVNIAILVLAFGKWLTGRSEFLRNYNIPEPVSGGVIASLLVWAIQAATGQVLHFDLGARDFLLVAFFACVGLESDLRTLISGGRPLLLLCILSTIFVYIQNAIAIGVGIAAGIGAGGGLLGGSVSLIGGHGTVIGMASTFATKLGIADGVEIGLTYATLGLIVSGMIGGPLAGWLISRYRLECTNSEQPDIGFSWKLNAEETRMDYMAVLRVLFFVNCSILSGRFLSFKLQESQIEMPEFVCTMFMGILVTNLLALFGKNQLLIGTRPLALVSEISLGIFLSMSLMSLQVWTILNAAGAIFLILLAQAAATVAFTVLVLFRLAGKSYEAAVTSAGFCGFALGATPTAMANMAAVTRKFGNSHRSFILVPIVGGFFLSVFNSLIILQFIAWVSPPGD